MGTRLWVGNLPFDATEVEVRELFAGNGRTVVKVILKSDRVTGRPAGFGFVEMGSDELAQQAVRELNGHMLRGRPMRVNEARPPGSGPGPRGPRRDGPRLGGPGGGGPRRSFPGSSPPPDGSPTPFGVKHEGGRGRKARREHGKERTERREEGPGRGGGGRMRRDGSDPDDD